MVSQPTTGLPFASGESTNLRMVAVVRLKTAILYP